MPQLAHHSVLTVDSCSGWLALITRLSVNYVCRAQHRADIYISTSMRVHITTCARRLYGLAQEAGSVTQMFGI